MTTSFLCRYLRTASPKAVFTVFKAYDGLEGVRVYMEASPDVVLCDLIMPQMGGADTCSEIDRLAGAGQPVIVMISSTFQEPPHEHDVLKMGAKVHIPKYTRPVDIVIIVEQLLERDKYPQS
jgi:DNA-binding NarL/FixJ family response regulator